MKEHLSSGSISATMRKEKAMNYEVTQEEMNLHRLEREKSSENEAKSYYSYKDRVFRLLFCDKKKLLELYNALNHTAYTSEEDLTVNTLNNAIFMKMKNDISFVVESEMCLYEHQSSYCPNMPLRGFFYFADLYKKLIRDIDLSIRRKIRIPPPHYIVFYNGLERKEEEFEQRLSEVFESDEEGCMELVVRTINVNFGKNTELMKNCKTLYEYSYFVATVRRYQETKELTEAVNLAVEECIEANILREFLTEQKAEVIGMSIYEYNEEYVRKTLLEDGEALGEARGRAEGRTEGKALSVASLMQKMQLPLQEACDIIGITIEEYNQYAEQK